MSYNKKSDNLIWTNYDLDYEDYAGQIEEAYPERSEEEKLRLMYEINNDYLDDERVNLNIQLSRPILIVADLGLWRGRRMGYKEIISGNIRDCLYSDADYVTWYLDDAGDFRCDAIHHDGTNHYLYRTYKSNTTFKQIQQLKDKLFYGKPAQKEIDQFTISIGKNIKKIYGI